MIEITHQHAQRLIRKEMDSSSGGRRIPEEQWAMLQAHLEHCQECRAYARRRQTAERELGRVLHLRWNPVNGPHRTIGREVCETRRRTLDLRRKGKKVLLWLGGILAVFAFLTARNLLSQSSQEKPQATPTVQAEVVLPTPTPVTIFRGVLAFEASLQDNAEIFLLNSGPGGVELTNLSQHPAKDSSPAWSPDGEWLAFLSDRDTADGEESRSEIYIMHVAGSRLTRLTADPRLDWRGPLSWSHDGRWVAARAARLDQEGDTYIYLVPLTGSSPASGGLRSIAFSRNAGPPVMSPDYGMLAFQSSQPEGSLLSYNMDNGRYGQANTRELAEDLMRAGGVYEWSMGGQRLVYTAEGPYDLNGAPLFSEDSRSEVVVSPAADFFASQQVITSGAGGYIVDSSPAVGYYRSASWVPESLLVAMVSDADGDGCWTVHMKPNNRLDMRTRELDGLCLEGNLAAHNWLPLASDFEAARWLVVRARLPQEERPWLYAVRMNTMLESVDAPIYERIQLPGLNGLDNLGEPQARPGGFRLGIQPRALQPAEGALPALPVEPKEAMNLIASAGPKGNQSLVRLGAGGIWETVLSGIEFTCPTLSPDGRQAAFLSFAPDPGTQINDVFVVDLNEEDPARQLTSADLAGDGTSFIRPTSRYGCPVWSPDGKQLAAVLYAPQQTYLAIIPADGSSPPGYLAIEAVPLQTPPVWLSGDAGDQIFLFYQSPLVSPARIIALDPASEANQAALETYGKPEVNLLQELPGYTYGYAMIVTPDGTQFAVVATDRQAGTDFITGPWGGELSTHRLAFYDATQAQPQSLAWLPDGKIGVLHYQVLNRPEKARLLIFDPESRALTPLASLEDQTSSAAWAADGSWVFYTGESGLWGLSIPGALAGESAPARLLPAGVYGLDIR